MTKLENSYQDVPLMGSQEPSVRVAPLYRYSDGEDAIRLLAIGDMELDPWQRGVLCDWMARDEQGRWAAPTSGGSVPRQNGKTLDLQGRIAAGMILFNEQVVYTAHLQKTATETFGELKAFFLHPKIKKYVFDIKNALGREEIILRSGARVKFLARTRNGGRGQHGDLLIVDEAQEMDEQQQESFLPAISASVNPQTIYVGTPPGPGTPGTVFRGIRRKAIEDKADRLAWFEFSVDEIGDVYDKKRWAATNPALGRRIMLSTIEAEVAAMAPDSFARERLGWWPPVVEDKDEYVLDEGAWRLCASAERKPSGKTAYGVKFSPDGLDVSLCGAVCPENGPARISLIERKPTSIGVQWLADWLNVRYARASCVVIDGRNGVDVLVDKIRPVWKSKYSVIKPKVSEVLAAVSNLTNEVSEQTVTWYVGQEALLESAVTSTKRPIGGGFGFGGPNSTPIEAASLALWGCRTCKRDPTREMRIG